MKIKQMSLGCVIRLPLISGIRSVTASVNNIRSAAMGGIEAKKSLQVLQSLSAFFLIHEQPIGFCTSLSPRRPC